MKKHVISLIFYLLLVCSCTGDSMKDLRRAEQALVSNPLEAGLILDKMNPDKLHGRQAAFYGMLRTRIDYVSGKAISSDSLARIATDYWGSRRKGKYTSLSWQSLGYAYSSMNRDAEAIYALMKSRDLSKDTLSYDLAAIETLLGNHFRKRGLFDEAADAFSESYRKYRELGDCRLASFSEFNLGRVYLEQKNYQAARDIMGKMLKDRCLDADSRNTCYLYMAHIINGISGKNAGREELEYVDAFLKNAGSDEDIASGYAMKGIALYYLNENDSAFAYLEQAHRLSGDLSTKIFAIKGLEGVAIRMKRYQEAWNAEILIREYQDELDKQSNESEITRIRLQYNDEIQEHKYRSRVSRIIMLSVLILIILIAVVILVNIQRDRKREAYYLKMHDDFIKRQIEEKAETVENRLVSACESFRSGIAFNMINDVVMEHRGFKPDERDVILHDVNLYFSNQIASLREEAGRLGQQDIMLIFCNVLGLDQGVTADIMCTSRSNMRSIKSRLKSKISAESFSLYFKE